jgi:hypothetical protein
MSDPKYINIIHIEIELPTEFAVTLDERYWLRLTAAIESIMRIPLGADPPVRIGSVWKVN